MQLLLLAAILSCAPAQTIPSAPADAQRAPAGTWSGRVEQVKVDFDLTLRWDGDTLTGTIDIPAQGYEDGPLTGLTLAGRDLTFKMKDVPGDPTFVGVLDADAGQVAGQYTQSGATFPFQMTRSEPTAARAAALLGDFDDWLARERKRLRVPGLAAAVVWRGEVVLARGYGLADAGSGALVTADTVFAIGSTTKAFTAFALAQAVEAGLLDWDEPVRKWLTDFALDDDFAAAHLTLRDMCSHRSGMPRHDLVWYANPGVPRSELVARLAHLEPSVGFREQWQYNNLMFIAAGVALERATGQSWEQRVREGILAPLGMTHTTLGLAETLASSDFARPHDRKRAKDVVVPFRDLTQAGPAGSIHSSANDMARWMGALLARGKGPEGPLLSASSLGELFTPISVIRAPGKPTAYGLGWMLDSREGHTRVHHGGAIDGFTAAVELYPDDRLGVFVVSNRASPLTSLAAAQLAERFLGLEQSDTGALAASQLDLVDEGLANMKKARESERVKDAPPVRPLGAYAARYHHAGYGDLEVALVEGGLRFRYGTFDAPLEPWHFEVFRCGEAESADAIEGLLAHFRDDVGGFIEAVEVPFEPSVKPIRFERLADAALSSPELAARCTGEYTLLGQVIRVEQSGPSLKARVTGQPTLTLVPATHGRFKLDIADGYWMRFELPESGPATALIVTQPNGTFRAERRAE